MSDVQKTQENQRFYELFVKEVRSQGGKTCASVLEALIETKQDAKNPGNTPFPGFFLAQIFLI